MRAAPADVCAVTTKGHCAGVTSDPKHLPSLVAMKRSCWVQRAISERLTPCRFAAEFAVGYWIVFVAVFEWPLSVPAAEYAVTTKYHCAGPSSVTT